MLTDAEIKRKGFKIRFEKLGDVDAEKCTRKQLN